MSDRKAAKTAWMRDASGRFLSARTVRAMEAAEAGKVFADNVHGTIRYRDDRGRFVPKDIAQATRGGVKRRLGKGDKARGAAPPPEAERSRAPSGYTKVEALDTWGHGLYKLIDGNGAEGRDTFIRWKGSMYRVGPGKAAALSDTFRVMTSDYMADLGDFVDYPIFRVDVIETDQGDVIDMDRVTVFNEQMEEDLAGDVDAEKAAQRFRGHVESLMDAMIPPKRRARSTRSSNPKGHSKTRRPDSGKGGRRRRK